MTAPHPYVAIRSTDQWRRVAHFDTALTVSKTGVSLAELKKDESEVAVIIPEHHSYLAFDPFCRLFRLLPEAGQINFWPDIHNLSKSEALPLFETPDQPLGEFTLSDPHIGPLKNASGLSVDSSGHLFVSETSVNRIWVFDLIDKRLIRSINLPDGTQPADSDADGLDVYVLTKNGLGKLSASKEFYYPSGVLEGKIFDRVTVMNGEIFLLENAGTADAKVISWNDPQQTKSFPFATDLVWSSPERLIVAFQSSQLFEEYIIENKASLTFKKNRSFRAKNYDGRGIVRAPDGRIAYFSTKGFRYALPVKPRYKTRGRIVSFALDSEIYQNQWGLAFVDACLPKGCDMRVRFHTSDELENFTLPRLSAANDTIKEFGSLPAPKSSPAMPRDTAFVEYATAKFEDAGKLYRRGKQDELIWDEDTDDEHLVTYETPVTAKPGRFLWVAIELTSNGLNTPYIRGLRVQRNGHKLLQHLPRLYSREPKVESFLRRYLALPESLINEFDVSAITRHVLLDPSSCREEWLAWLASFVGLIFDERFNPDTRRQLISEAVWLFRFRGTVQGLERFLKIYANNQLGFNTVIQIVEKFKFRGHASMIETDTNQNTGSVLGVDYRMGFGQADNEQTGLNSQTGSDEYAHRFNVLVAANLSTEEMEVFRHIIAVHRPAHTVFDVCTVDAGMRIGRGLYLELNSFVGQSAGFIPLHLESGTLGRNGVLGIAKTATTASGGQVGINARLG